MKREQEMQIRTACRLFLKATADMQDQLITATAEMVGVEEDEAAGVWADQITLADIEVIKVLGVIVTAPDNEGG